MVSNSELQAIIKKNQYLNGRDGDWRSYWQDVNNFCLPRKAWITTMKIYGEQLKFNFLYDSRAILAAKKSAAGFHGKLTNPNSKWFDFRAVDDRFMQSGANQRYFRECSQIQYGTLNQSNWNDSLLEYYQDDVVDGSTCMATEEDYKTNVRYTNIPLEQIHVELDERGELLNLYRNFKYNLIQAARKFGLQNLTKDMQKMIDDGKDYETVDVLHLVGPRDVYDSTKKDNKNMAFRSLWINPKEKHLFAEGGFTSNIYSFERFWVHGNDVFGYSPAMDALASIKLANAQKRTLIRRAMKESDSANAQPARFWLGRFSQNPNAMNYYDKTKFTKEDFFQIPNGGNFQIGSEMMQMEQQLIDEAFFIPLFQALTNVSKDMNVPETQQRIAESLNLIGPIVGRMLNGIENAQMRTFEILDRRLLFPPTPKELEGQDMKMLFLNPLAKAQRASELSGLSMWQAFMKAQSELTPDIIHYMDIDNIGPMSADMYNVDPKFVRDRGKVQDIIKKINAAKQQQAKMEMAAQGAAAAKDAATAKHQHAQSMAVK